MKRIGLVLMVLLLLVGCSGEQTYTMIENEDGKYGMVGSDMDVEKVEFPYSNIQAVKENGYIVKNKDGKGYIDSENDAIIKIEKGQDIELAGDILLISKDEEVQRITDLEGTTLFEKDKDTEIYMYDLPVVKKKNSYSIIDKQGKVFFETEKDVQYVTFVNALYILISYTDEACMVNTTTTKESFLKIKGKFECRGESEEDGFLFYNSEQKEIVYVTPELKLGFVKQEDVDSLSFDSNHNIVIMKNDVKYLLTKEGDKKIEVESYYQGAKTYVKKNDRFLYGPHYFYKNDIEVEVEGIQLEPTDVLAKQGIFPIYAKGEGFQYYNFSGEAVSDTTYLKASAFDANDVAIVSTKKDIYYMLDLNHKKISNDYQRIERIGKQYYAGYKTQNEFEIIDALGQLVLEDSFMGDKEIITYQDVDYGIFSTNGKSYVYVMESQELVMSCEGELSFNSLGYFSVGKTYYSMKGERIYSR